MKHALLLLLAFYLCSCECSADIETQHNISTEPHGSIKIAAALGSKASEVSGVRCYLNDYEADYGANATSLPSNATHISTLYRDVLTGGCKVRIMGQPNDVQLYNASIPIRNGERYTSVLYMDTIGTIATPHLFIAQDDLTGSLAGKRYIRVINLLANRKSISAFVDSSAFGSTLSYESSTTFIPVDAAIKQIEFVTSSDERSSIFFTSKSTHLTVVVVDLGGTPQIYTIDHSY